MKAMFFSLVAVIVLTSSCSQKFSLQKRKYTKGYYFAGSHSKKTHDAGKKQDLRPLPIEEPAEIEYAVQSQERKNDGKAALAATEGNVHFDQKTSTPINTKLILPPARKKITVEKEPGLAFHKNVSKLQNKIKTQKRSFIDDFNTGYFVIALIGCLVLFILYSENVLAAILIALAIILLVLLVAALGKAINNAW